MNDTSPEVAALYRRLLMRRSGEERLRMACDMFDTARALMRAHLVASGHALGETELRVQIFLRTYGADFDAGARTRIVARLHDSG